MLVDLFIALIDEKTESKKTKWHDHKSSRLGALNYLGKRPFHSLNRREKQTS